MDTHIEPGRTLDNLEAALRRVRQGGQRYVEIAAFEDLTAVLRKNAAMSIDEQRLADARALAHYAAVNTSNLEVFKSVLDAGKDALNALLLVNGGAVVALLGFLGTTLARGLSASLGLHLTVPLLSFGLGVLAGAVSSAIRYITQFCGAMEWRRMGAISNAASILAALSGYAAFSFGLFGAYQAFTVQFHP